MASWTGYVQEGLSDMSEEATIDEDAFEGWNGMLDALNPAKVKLNVLLLAIPVTLYSTPHIFPTTLS